MMSDPVVHELSRLALLTRSSPVHRPAPASGDNGAHIGFAASCFRDKLIEMNRTSELWVKKKGAAATAAPSLL